MQVCCTESATGTQRLGARAERRSPTQRQHDRLALADQVNNAYRHLALAAVVSVHHSQLIVSHINQLHVRRSSKPPTGTGL